ncbi:hypothetical protein J4G08_20725 [Candidatus Poribacteria bacterium]|nr:hypothetical protein [Candidatus Poribacteria bacterium]
MEENHHAESLEHARKLNRLACKQISDGNLEEAKENLIEAIHIAPNLAAPHTNLGVLHCWDGELDEAIALHLKARPLKRSKRTLTMQC